MRSRVFPPTASCHYSTRDLQNGRENFWLVGGLFPHCNHYRHIFFMVGIQVIYYPTPWGGDTPHIGGTPTGKRDAAHYY